MALLHVTVSIRGDSRPSHAHEAHLMPVLSNAWVFCYRTKTVARPVTRAGHHFRVTGGGLFRSGRRSPAAIGSGDQARRYGRMGTTGDGSAQAARAGVTYDPLPPCMRSYIIKSQVCNLLIMPRRTCSGNHLAVINYYYYY